MQPVQLSLLPEPDPAPLALLIARLPEADAAAAVTLLAALIARTAAGISVREVTGGE
jgi:hypothetical protein